MIRVFNSSYGIQNEWVMQNCVMHNMATETKQQNMKYIRATHTYIHTYILIHLTQIDTELSSHENTEEWQQLQ